MLLRNIPRSEWPQLRLKVLTAEVLQNRRPEWGYGRKWEGNYLGLVITNIYCHTITINDFNIV